MNELIGMRVVQITEEQFDEFVRKVLEDDSTLIGKLEKEISGIGALLHKITAMTAFADLKRLLFPDEQ